MGLDMYLEGQKYILSVGAKRPMEDGFELKTKRLSLGYWRKHPDLHGFIVQEFAGGEDDCRDVHLEADDLRKIIEAIRKKECLNTTGFFFGQSYDPSDPAYNEQVDAESIAILEKAIAWLEQKEDGIYRDVYYRASW